MAKALVKLLRESDAPAEQYTRLGLPRRMEDVKQETVMLARENLEADRRPCILKQYKWSTGAQNMYHGLSRLLPPLAMEMAGKAIETAMVASPSKQEISQEVIIHLITQLIPEKDQNMVLYFARILGRTD